MHWIEDNHEVPRWKTKIESGEFICSTAEDEKFVEVILLGSNVEL